MRIAKLRQRILDAAVPEAALFVALVDGQPEPPTTEYTPQAAALLLELFVEVTESLYPDTPESLAIADRLSRAATNYIELPALQRVARYHQYYARSEAPKTPDFCAEPDILTCPSPPSADENDDPWECEDDPCLGIEARRNPGPRRNFRNDDVRDHDEPDDL